MSQSRPRVTLSGDLTGAYVVLEERPDGSLVLARDGSQPPAPPGGARPGSDEERSPLARLLMRAPEASASAPELLSRWGVELRDGETVLEFLTVTLDGGPVFLALTTERLVAVPAVARGARVVREYTLASVARVALERHGMTAQLRVVFDTGELVIGGVSRADLRRLRERMIQPRPQ